MGGEAVHLLEYPGNIGRLAEQGNTDVPLTAWHIELPLGNHAVYRRSQGAPGECQATPLRSSPAITATLCPPNPKLLDMIAVISRSRGVFGV